jgi:ribose transport system substrate-binding protein
MEMHRRRLAISELLQEMGDVAVDDLAARFSVSENTIRNDLKAMEAANLLRRVRGGAVAVDEGVWLTNSEFARRFEHNRKAKEQLGRYATTLIANGDAIVLDASSTIYHLARFLKNHNDLTVVTNGLASAQMLAKNPTNRVILAANDVRADGLAVNGNLQPDLLNHFFASKCFVTGSGLSAEQGITEGDRDEAPLKYQMMKLARQVIALIDHSKIGKIDTYRFADLNHIDHLITDDGASDQSLLSLRMAANFPITVVGPKSERVVEPSVEIPRQNGYRVGFGNMTENMLFAQQVRRSIERAARDYDNIELLIRDNKLDSQVALENADWFVEKDVDLVIEYQIDALVGNIIMDKFNRAGIPVIAIDIPMPGATFFGADNYRAGFIAGEGLGHWIEMNWDREPDILLKLESSRVGPLGGARLQGQHDGLESVLGPLNKDQIVSVDSPVIVEAAESAIQDLLPDLSTEANIAVIAINDDAALGALAAFEEAGRLSQVVAVGQNADRLGRAALRRAKLPFVGSTAYAPEQYGKQILEIALRILEGQAVPPAVYNQHTFITRENVDEYYPESTNTRVVSRL